MAALQSANGSPQTRGCLVYLLDEVFPEYVHGTFFWEKDRRSVLVQVLNAIELSTQGEFREVPAVEIKVNSAKINIKSAKVLWPAEQELPIRSRQGNVEITLTSPPRYTALRLQLA